MRNIKETIRPYVGYAFFAFIALIFLGAVLTPFFGKASAQDDKKTLQESVEQAQIKYDNLKKIAREDLQKYCNSWKELGLAKRELLKNLQITDPNANRVYDNCKEDVSWYVPDSF